MAILPETLLLPPRIRTGVGMVTQILVEGAAFGSRGLLIHGQSLEHKGVLRKILDEKPQGVEVRAWCFEGGEPALDELESLLRAARACEPDWIAAVGGGSVLDIAKAAAGLLDAPLPVRAYHDGEAIPGGCTPFLAAPTTAGTGSEVTIVSVLTNRESGVKKSIRHPSFMARLVILDPELLAGCPRRVTACSGMDAFTQAAESFTSRHATWFTDCMALEGLRLIDRSLPAVVKGEGGQAAEDLMLGSTLAGVALSNARLGLVHGLAHPLGARFHEPHGLVCAVCLPHVLAFNREAMGDKYDRMSRTLGKDLLARTDRLLDTLGIESPFRGRPLADRAAVVSETLASGSTQANPRPVEESDVERILDRLFDPAG